MTTRPLVLRLHVLWPRMGALLPLALLLVLVLGQVIAHPPVAQDDLLRNVVAFAWHYDYTQLYPMAAGMPSFDPYIGFDWFWGLVSRLAGPVASMHLAQLAGVTVFLAALLAPLRDCEERVFRVTLVLAATLATLVTSRLVGGRPEVLATAWLLCAASLRPLAWLGLGILLSPAYWLMPVYAVGGLLLPGRLSARMAWVAAATAASSSFWLAYAGLDWVHGLLDLPAMASMRAVPAVEAGPLSDLFKHPGTWLLCALLGWTGLYHRTNLRELRWLLVATVFVAIGSVRHVLVLAPVVALFVARQPWSTPRLGHWCTLSALAIVAGTMAMQQLPSSLEPAFRIPERGTVLTTYSRNVFLLPFHNPGTVSVVPSIESAWDAPQAVELAQAAAHGDLSCDQLASTSIAWVIARAQLNGECFDAVEQREGWTLWRVRPTDAAPGR